MAPRRSQEPHLRPNIGQIANGEINRKSKDANFKVNQSLFYAQTPREDLMRAKDEEQFYRGMTPLMDQKSVNNTQERLRQTA